MKARCSTKSARVSIQARRTLRVNWYAAAARLEVFSEHDERYYYRRAFEKQVFRVAHVAERNLDRGVDAVQECRKRTDGNERVHVGMALHKATEAVYVEAEPADDDGQSQGQLHECKGERRVMRRHEARQRKSCHASHGHI